MECCAHIAIWTAQICIVILNIACNIRVSILLYIIVKYSIKTQLWQGKPLHRMALRYDLVLVSQQFYPHTGKNHGNNLRFFFSKWEKDPFWHKVLNLRKIHFLLSLKNTDKKSVFFNNNKWEKKAIFLKLSIFVSKMIIFSHLKKKS